MKNFIICAYFIFALCSLSAAQGTNVAEYLAKRTREADTVVITYYSSGKMSRATFKDADWIERLAKALEASSYTPENHCFCISYPEIELFRGKEPLGMLSVHHGSRLRAYAGEVRDDFMVGGQTGGAIVAMAREKKGLTSH
jgi:hypothetical protein